MKTLSVRQPWAWLIVNGFKNIENRTWRLRHRGPLLIHAGKAWDDCYDPRHPERFQQEIGELIEGAPILPSPLNMQRGGIVGEVEVIGCVISHFSPWFSGPFGIVVRNQKPLPFVPCRGSLGLFDVDYEKMLSDMPF